MSERGGGVDTGAAGTESDGAGRDAAEARAQAIAAARVHGPPPPTVQTPLYAGIVTRALAFAVDAAIVDGTGIAVGVVVGLALSILNLPHDAVVALAALGGALFVVWSISYFVAFWSTTGQTPGSRTMRIRVEDAQARGALGVRRSLVRFAGLTLAAIPLGAGFLPILVTPRRRGFQDWLARTVVVHVPETPPAAPDR